MELGQSYRSRVKVLHILTLPDPTLYTSPDVMGERTMPSFKTEPRPPTLGVFQVPLLYLRVNTVAHTGAILKETCSSASCTTLLVNVEFIVSCTFTVELYMCTIWLFTIPILHYAVAWRYCICDIQLLHCQVSL